MAEYLVGQIAVRDPQLWEQYVVGVRGSLEPFGAELVFRGKKTAVLAGSQERELGVVIRFADHEELLRWYRSDAYQALIPLRDRAADVVLVGYGEMG